MSHLVPCSACQRHVQVIEARCPFCGVARSPEQRSSPPPAMPGHRLGRAALFAFGATMLSAAVCSDGSGGGKDAGMDTPAEVGGGGSGGSGAGSGGAGSGGAGSGGQSGTGGAASDAGGGGTDGAVDRSGTGGGVAPAYGITPLYGAPAPRDQNEGN
ncbi:MAG TPA: hypothetical protein VMU50_00215 [Polyangia bacterium]|nr:hypothetical protein [Polyangia bacterium]